MRTPFFDSAKAIDALDREAAGWHGTPFVPHAAIKCGGVDCVNLCGEILRACGVKIPDNRQWPRYVMDGGKHNGDSQLTAWLSGQYAFSLAWTAGGPTDYVVNGLAGDVLCFRLGRSSHHAGLFLGGTKFVHSMFGRAVEFRTLADCTYQRRLVMAFRPMKV